MLSNHRIVVASLVTFSILGTMQKVFVCPEVRVPKLQRPDGDRKRQREPEIQRPNGKFDTKKPKTEKEELRGMMATIKQYNSQTLEGMSMKAYKEHKLTKLGAAPPKQQTMPFKMKMGIIAGRKKRNQREKALDKEGGVVRANQKIKSKHHKRH